MKEFKFEPSSDEDGLDTVGSVAKNKREGLYRFIDEDNLYLIVDEEGGCVVVGSYIDFIVINTTRKSNWFKREVVPTNGKIILEF